MSLKRSSGAAPGIGSTPPALINNAGTYEAQGDIDMNGNVLRGPVVGVERGVRVYRTTAKELATATKWSPEWDVADFNYDTMWEGVTNPERVTVAADGIYILSGSVYFQETLGNDPLKLEFRVNGTNLIYLNEMSNGGTNWAGITGTTTIQLSKGDYVELLVTQSSGANATVKADNTGTWFSVVPVTAPISDTPLFDLANSIKDTADTPDDEFDSTTLDAKWTAVSGSSGTVSLTETGEVEKYDLSTRRGWLLIQAGSGAGQMVELRQDFTLGDGDSIVVALSAPGSTTDAGGSDNNEFRAGISLNSTDTGYADGTYVFLAIDGQTDEVEVLAYDGSTIFGTSQGNNAVGGMYFLRITRSTLTYYFHWSTDGTSWHGFSEKTFGTAPNNLWLFGGSPVAGNDPVPIVAVKWIRQGSSDLDPWNPYARAAIQENLAGTWMNALFARPPDETVHTDDQEFTGTIAGTAVTPTGTATWTQGKSILGVAFEEQAANDLAVRLYSLTPTSSPVTIETALRFMTPGNSNNPTVGVVLTDGTSSTSNAVFVYMTSGEAHTELHLALRHGTLTDVSTKTFDVALAENPQHVGHAYLRLIWSAANTFEMAYSIDGVVWSDFASTTASKTMTPTHFGVGVSSYQTGTSEILASFDYLRVTESDLSV